jgi:hypothetical protein
MKADKRDNDKYNSQTLQSIYLGWIAEREKWSVDAQLTLNPVSAPSGGPLFIRSACLVCFNGFSKMEGIQIYYLLINSQTPDATLPAGALVLDL